MSSSISFSGDEAIDSIGDSSMSLPTVGSTSPEWILSDALIPPVSHPKEGISLNPEDLLPFIGDFCHDVILSGPLNE